MSRPDPLSSPQRARLGIVRVAMLAGVIMFGVVTWFLRRSGPAPGGIEAGPLDTITYGAMIAGIAGIVVMRRVVAAATDAARYANMAVIGWAFGELAALAGAVHYFMTGDPTRYVIGVMVMLLSFVLIPLRRT